MVSAHKVTGTKSRVKRVNLGHRLFASPRWQRPVGENFILTWSQWYALRNYLKASLWIVPLIALVSEQLVLRTAFALDARVNWIPAWPLDPAGTKTAVETIITLVLSFIVFTFGSMLVAIQIAGGQLTPRIIATTLLRDNVIRVTVGLFIFTMLFAIGVVARIEPNTRGFPLWIVSALGLGSVAAFLYLIDYAARLMRPASIVWQVAEDGLAAIKQVYPIEYNDAGAPVTSRTHLGAPNQILYLQRRSRIVLAVDLKSLIAEAKRLNGVIEFVPCIGDFVAIGEPIFKLYNCGGAIRKRSLRGAVAFGLERTIEQDSTFAFRVIVDIAIKALSKAINDPTTAVLSIDQLQRLLRDVGRRDLGNEQIVDDAGELRVLLRTPKWEDFTQLAFREIRFYGAENLQIARRLRAMIDNLMETLPESRMPALVQERDLLDQAIDRLYSLPGDAALARIPDVQGIGGASRT